MHLFASKQAGPIVTRQLAAGISALALSPRGDSLIVERAGQWQQFALDNPWPDFSWRNLWQKIWYENIRSRTGYGSPPPLATAIRPNSA